MAQVTVSLPDDLSAWAEARVAEGRFPDVTEYVHALVRWDRENEEKLARLQAAIDEGLASPEVDTTIEDIIAERHAAQAAE